ncbi:succinate dehydrogenase subunit 7B, mitochondrial-like, partial [Cicer arietinum]|uniref:succinate dehydrogenase subunit 7B, mitochondrial-like n=1 Tax=Cicer arietinum TaxID=3827 RepID=UPI003CC5D12A
PSSFSENVNRESQLLAFIAGELVRRSFQSISFTIEKCLWLSPVQNLLQQMLLAEDSALKPFKSYKQSVKKLRKFGDVLTIVVVAELWVNIINRED